MFVVNAGLIETGLFYCCLRGRVVWYFDKRKQGMFVWYYVACETSLFSLSNTATRVISDKKQSARTERSINIGRKTIQVSNFYSRAETNINLKERLFVFWRKTAQNLRKQFFKPYKVRFNFSKKRKRFFLLKKILNETRNIAVSFSENGKVFYFTCNRTEKIALYFLPKSYRGGKRHLFKRRQIGWHANKISL